MSEGNLTKDQRFRTDTPPLMCDGEDLASIECKTAVLAALEPEVKDIEEEYSEHQIAIRDEQIEQLQRANESLQARIDALMLEFCPSEMSISQREAWAAAQERAAVETSAVPDLCPHGVSPGYPCHECTFNPSAHE